MAKLIGTDPNQVPTNADLGTMAYQDYTVVGPYLKGGRRNLIINGAMQVWQRGTSFAAGGGLVYTADRFWRYSGTSGNIERSTDAPTGFAYSWYGNTTGVFSGGTTVEIENNGGRSGFFPQQRYVYSFYLKGDFSNTYLAVRFRNTIGTGTDEVHIITFSKANGNGFGNYSDWTRVQKVIDTTGYTPHANNKMLDLEFGSLPVGGKATGFQLEVGDTATPFEHRSYGDELARCQRYYCKSFPQGTAPTHDAIDCIYKQMTPYSGISFAGIGDTFPTEMRATPTVTLWTASPSSDTSTGRITYFDGSWQNTTANVHGGTSSTGYYFEGNATAATKLVQYNFEADAEL